MLHLASHEFAGRRILLVENDVDTASEMTASIEAAGGTIVGCVTNGFAAISYIKLWNVDTIVAYTDTLNKVPFSLYEVTLSLGVELMPVTSFDSWFETIDDEFDLDELSADLGLNQAA